MMPSSGRPELGAIHTLLVALKTWMPATSAGMTVQKTE
jgi:hypothetical protein